MTKHRSFLLASVFLDDPWERLSFPKPVLLLKSKITIMRLIPVIGFLGFACFLGHSQKSIGDALDRWNKGSVPYIRIAEVNQHSGAVFLDTRKKEEYNVSHLPKAHCWS